ncbi:hypothetical protein CYLTODRAFT_387638 [Cylindrobasidium torrendii FP15055 ss-10]|uniref:Flavin reductase like domain-containing protein n=1 Tax=Cylindrobasidium torrendii FP15055 ss-10 TaxID=1314674 RepID=A0A0D7BRS7_9AGAR|nr:hypothetical protein CYLTODRAFT_387638 [Cylindrobasidium torrendii FP15055 ss-10]
MLSYCIGRRLGAPRIICARQLSSTLSPNPNWKLGEGATASWKESSERSPRKSWNLAKTPPRDVYRLLTSAVVPRPIALVSTLSEDGTPNLAPFSYFSMISSNPPMLSVSFSLPPKRKKDTRENILFTKEFSVNLVHQAYVEAVNAAAVESSEPNEWLLSGLTMEPSVAIKAPCVKESVVCLECELHSHQDIAPDADSAPTTTLVLGRIKHVHVREFSLNEDGVTLNPEKLSVVSRLGGLLYAKVSGSDVFEVPRTVWKDIKQDYAKIVDKK